VANRKEYEMLFKLNSQLGGSFSGAFQKAQKELAELQKQVEALNKSQSDIKAYQRQQGSIGKTEEKLKLLQQQYDNIQREMQETGGYSSELENKLLSKQQQIDKTSASLDQQREKLERLGAAMKENGIDTDNLTEENKRLSGQLSELKEKEDDFGDAGAMAFDVVASAISAAGIAAALHEIADAYMECVTIAGNFEEGMSNVEALSGASAEEMQMLSDKAKELGATTKFTAQEASDAMGYMAMAGWDAQEMLSGMDGVLQLAAASGEDLAMVSDIVTDNLTAFGLTAADTARFADVLAAAATNSNTNVSIMGETFANAASIAGALGYSVEDVAVAVGLMANSGVKGSVAGTALKNTFNGLLEGVTLTGEAFGEYDYTAIKANGTMKSFSDTIDELRVYFDQMTEAERVNNAMAIAGERGYNGLLAILNATDEDYASLTASINNCTGAAQRMAEIKLDNMNGQLTIMKSAWDGLKISVGEQFTPAMEKLYGVGTKCFDLLNGFVQEHPALVKAVAAFVGVVAVATAGLTAYAAIAKVVAALNLASLFVTAAPIMLAVGAVAALTAGIVALASAESEEEKELRSLTAASRAQHTQLQDLTAQYEQAKETYGETSDEALALRYEVDQLTESYESNKKTLEEFVAENDALIESHNQIMSSFSDATASIGNEEQGALALAFKLDELTSKTSLTEEEQKQLLAVINALNDSVPDLALNYDTVTRSVNLSADAVKAAIKAQAQQEREAEKYRTWVDLTKEELLLEEQLAEATENLRLRKEELTAEGWNVDAPLIGWSTDLDDYEDEVERLTAAYNENQAALAELEEMKDYADATDSAAQSTEAMTLAIGETKERMEELAKAYTEVYDAALESVSGQYELWDEAEKVVATSASSINSNLQGQIAYWQEYNTNLASLRERTGDIEGLSDMIASFADGSTDSVNAVAGMAAASDADLTAMVKNWKNLQTEQNAVADNIAELKTNFSAEMDELGEALADDIAAMDLSAESTEAGRATIQGFIDGANGMLPQVQAAYARIASYARSALTPQVIKPGQGGQGGYLQQYASGTESAAPGFALVGEHGPELVYFNGGEQVVTAEETAAMRGGLSAEMQMVSFAPQLLQALSSYGNGAAYAEAGVSAPAAVINVAFQIEGNATPETVEQLRAYGDEFAERVREIIEEVNADDGRRVYR
jgi:TP901 family phage tail tape measure protein